ncbi:endolytic transglycosylase MltG [candidate division KSB1 bacterium]|nr:endolytic transglycosylase MltG [candidate division KSB1 bacterium]
MTSIGSLLVVAFGYVFWNMFWPLYTPISQNRVEVRIAHGAHSAQIADSLEAKGIVRSATWFLRTADLFGRANQLKAGYYQMPSGLSAYGALTRLVRGEQSYLRVTVPEGLTARQIANLMQRHLQIDSLSFMNIIGDSVFVRRMGLDVPFLEGYLYPDTYYFSFGTPESRLVERMIRQFKEAVPDSFYLRASDLGFDFHQILTLASIIEGEAILEREMTTISSVYHNRLQRRMPLQADPTIQYLIPDGPRRLLYRDLAIDSPYNTYLYAGLPPGPINNPGIAAISAALYPDTTDYLYFVADGRGGHRFSSTLQQHNAAKKQFDQIRRQVAREKREKERREQSGQ